MNNRTITLLVGAFLLIVVGLFILTFIQRSAIEDTVTPLPIVTEEESPYDYIDRIDAKHFFIDGTHTIVGEVMMPTPCDLLTWDVTIAESFPEQITVDFNVINNSESCIQVITLQRFKVEFSVSEEASISARFEGRRIDLNLIPAGAGETPDEFELFIKG